MIVPAGNRKIQKAQGLSKNDSIFDSLFEKVAIAPAGEIGNKLQNDSPPDQALQRVMNDSNNEGMNARNTPDSGNFQALQNNSITPAAPPPAAQQGEEGDEFADNEWGSQSERIQNFVQSLYMDVYSQEDQGDGTWRVSFGPDANYAQMPNVDWGSMGKQVEKFIQGIGGKIVKVEKNPRNMIWTITYKTSQQGGKLVQKN